jgi:NADH dehydrogenase (ubiquinone) 1 beta subcomplex subunit 9
MSGGVGPRPIITHAQRVCRLYKKAYRVTQDWADERWLFRFNAAVLRSRFDETSKIKDMRVLAKMVEEGEYEVWEQQHTDPRVFKNDPGGIVYHRSASPPDWALDQWHPWEKVQVMDIFNNREKLKAEFNEYYEKSLAKKYQPEGPAS